MKEKSYVWIQNKPVNARYLQLLLLPYTHMQVLVNIPTCHQYLNIRVAFKHVINILMLVY